MSDKKKAPLRAGNRTGVASGKRHAAERRGGRPVEPAACDRCGAVFSGRTWRRRGRLSVATLDAATWVVCPACRQQEAEEYLGRILVRLAPDDDVQAIRARVRNVTERAKSRQPQRRLVAMEQRGTTLEILTTSQKLAHRVAKEIVKAFGGTPSYAWSDDGSLIARVE